MATPPRGRPRHGCRWDREQGKWEIVDMQVARKHERERAVVADRVQAWSSSFKGWVAAGLLDLGFLKGGVEALLRRIKAAKGNGKRVWAETKHIICPRDRQEIVGGYVDKVDADRRRSVVVREGRGRGCFKMRALTEEAEEQARYRTVRIKRWLKDFILRRQLAPQHRVMARIALTTTNGNPEKAWDILRAKGLTPPDRPAGGVRYSARLKLKHEQQPRTRAQGPVAAQYVANPTRWEIRHDVREQWATYRNMLDVKKSSIEGAGLGLFATSSLSPGDLRLAYVGEWSKFKDKGNRYQVEHVINGDDVYFITPLNSNEFDEPSRMIEDLPPAAYVNHQKDPEKCNLVWNMEGDLPCLEVKKHVPKDTELFIDYGKSYHL
jgi:hypothetical protein